MADRAAVDRVFNAIVEQISEEVSALLGVSFVLKNHNTELLNKEQIFEIKRSRSVLSTMEISGDEEGRGFIITAQKDSIVLGGTLIMLPEDQIEENCKQRSFEGEAADAFGEVANIIAGVYTSVFLEMYPENLHFKRTDVNEFLPAKLDPAADLPFPPAEYFYSSCSVELEDKSMEQLEVIVPANLLGLDTIEAGADEQQHAESSTNKDSDSKNPPEPSPDQEQEDPEFNQTDRPDVQDSENPPPTENIDQPQEKYLETSIVDRVLKASISQCAEEIGAMLGVEIELSSLNTGYISKEEYFSKPRPKATSTQMLVSGEASGTSYFIVELKDAIYFGGTLVMLPEDELRNRMSSGELDGEIEDAFGEVANIISGGIVQNFDEMFPRKFHVKKGDVTAFTPTKVIPEDSDPFPNGEYYSISAGMECETQDLGHLSYLIPVELLHIPPRPSETGWGSASSEKPAEEIPEKQVDEEPQEDEYTQSIQQQKTEHEQTAEEQVQKETVEKDAVIALICQNISLSEPYSNILNEYGHTPISLAANDSFTSLRQNKVCGSILVIDKVDDDAFALIIKIRSETPSDQPLIVAGPDWTRSAVLKAVKYGVDDIIPTPATEEEIREKVEQNLKNSC